MDAELFAFDLPEALIAMHPITPRTAANLLVIDEGEQGFQDCTIAELERLLTKDDLLIVNDCKVLASRISGQKPNKDTKISFTFLEAKASNSDSNFFCWQVLAKPARRTKIGDVFCLQGGLEIEILAKEEDGSLLVNVPLDRQEFYNYLDLHGEMPLPPYIEKARKLNSESPLNKEDHNDYQTIFAKHQGAVAAPTAGLHIDQSLRKKLENKGVTLLSVTLLVGAGTFMPMKVMDTKDHIMHAEWGQVSVSVADAINHHAKHSKGRIIALGTTSLRILEAAAQNLSTDNQDKIIAPFEGMTSIFITPGYQFKVIDSLITNFHLPKSTLFMLTCALAGLERMQAAYKHAIDKKYRFYSYGDACMISANKKRVKS